MHKEWHIFLLERIPWSGDSFSAHLSRVCMLSLPFSLFISPFPVWMVLSWVGLPILSPGRCDREQMVWPWSYIVGYTHLKLHNCLDPTQIALLFWVELPEISCIFSPEKGYLGKFFFSFKSRLWGQRVLQYKLFGLLNVWDRHCVILGRINNTDLTLSTPPHSEYMITIHCLNLNVFLSTHKSLCCFIPFKNPELFMQ